MRSRRSVYLGVIAVTMAGTVLATGAVAQASPEPSGPTQTVQLALTPRDRAGLQELADEAPNLSDTTRQARLAQVVAGQERADIVATRAQALGFHVEETDPTWVTISGPASLVTTYFGSARAQDASSSAGQALPTLPASLRSLVTIAAGGDETRPAFRHSGLSQLPLAGSVQPLTQSDLRTLYNIPGTTGKPTSTSPAIATMQFSDWNPSDLTTYAHNTGVYGGDTSYDPVAAGGYTAVQIDGGATDSDGAIEVSLDQSALATVASQFRQVAYFAPNDVSEQARILNQLALDATSRNIFAVSTSWGACEHDIYSGSNGVNRRAADQDAVNAALGAGLTIFAASGDHASLDCSPQGPNAQTPSVDAPAVIPGVIAVGGTTVAKNGGTYTETAWSGSGGGLSSMFCASAAQAAILPLGATKGSCPFGKARGVPDIAMDADVNSGLVIYVNGQAGQVGGTSLSAPLAAGSFAQVLLTNNFLRGAGDVSSVIQASNGTSAFRDIVGAPASPAWDPVTGSGSPNWTVLGARITGRTLTNSIYDVTTNTTTGFVEVRELSAASGYQTVVKSIQTPLQVNTANWQLMIAPYGGDGMRDLYAIGATTTGSNHVEVHVLSEASSYQTFIAHIATPMPVVSSGKWQFTLGGFAGDGNTNLYAINYASSGSNTVEIHALSAASSYQTWIQHSASALPALPIGPTSWTFFIGDKQGGSDLITVIKSNTGSGMVEVHTLTQASGYQAFSLHVATPFPATTAPGVKFGVTDYNSDGSPDIGFSLMSNTGSGKTEIHVLNGASNFTTYVLHVATALPYLDPTQNTVNVIR